MHFLSINSIILNLKGGQVVGVKSYYKKKISEGAMKIQTDFFLSFTSWCVIRTPL